VAVKPDATFLNFILTNGSTKNCPNDMQFDFPRGVGGEIWQLQGDCGIYTAIPPFKVGDVNKAKAYFVSRDTIAWPQSDAGNAYRLYYSLNGGISSSADGVSGGQWIPLNFDAAGLSQNVLAKFPFLSGAAALKLPAVAVDRVPTILKGQMVVAKFDGSTLLDATALQPPGVIDELYSFNGKLGAITEWDSSWRDDDGLDDWQENANGLLGHGSKLRFRLWAPTAQSVKLHIFDGPTTPASTVIPMRFNPRTGVWRASGEDRWVNRKYYVYEVKVWVRSTGKVETNLVTDPYSLGLAANSARSLIVDLDDAAAKPAGWSQAERPHLAAAEDIVLYELHVRDFSANDASVPAADRGKFRAFSHTHSNGMHHLQALQQAGLTHIHLLPSFDISSVPEVGCVTPDVPNAVPDSEQQQAAIEPVRDQDCFNWGYDPVHYAVPEGSYASNPDGLARIVEFRALIDALHRQGLRVVMDVVYNHTAAAGQNKFSVLDKIVPDYYYRLDGNGFIFTSTCCSDTASEHAMMGKLLMDTALNWASEYRIDGFRFDLMGFHPKEQILRLKSKLKQIDPGFYIYGEGWNFGEVANNARFVQASQLNLAGSGIGTFSDRMRDGVRGGGPFDGGEFLIKNQGFINGLWYDPNALAGPPQDSQRDLLLHYADWVRLGLAGTLKDYVFIDKDGNSKKGSEIDYNGQPAGYVSDPQEVINYVSAHDNQTLFDNDQFKMPTGASMTDRVRVNNLGVAIVLLSQGVPFFHAGDDILRSKSLDRDSFNSGDWFNRLDFTYQSNNWGVGLPPAFTGNQDNWPVMRPLLADPSLQPAFADITAANAYFHDMLKIRKSSPLFRLRSGAEVMQRLKFYNVGPTQIPGLIVETLADDAGTLDRKYKSITVLINVDKVTHSFTLPGYSGRSLKLHPVQQASSADLVVKASSFDSGSGTFVVTPRSTAVFVEQR
jgi:pullulanase